MNKLPIKWVLAISLVLALGGLMLVGVKLNNTNNALTVAKRDIGLLKEGTVKYENDLIGAKHKLAECAKKIADPAKRNVSDMRDYIMARYSKVPSELAAIIAQTTNEVADKHDVDFALVVGVMDVESAFNPFAISKKDARGLMQVMFKYWGKQYGAKKPSDLHDIGRNIEIGIQVLKHYIDKNKGSISKALTDYNGGGKTYANEVYVAIGRFTAFRNNTYQDKPEKKEKVDAKRSSIPAGNSGVLEGIQESS